MNRHEILESFPLLAPNAEECFVVMGDDLDSLLSTMLFIRNHPAARIAGFYEKYTDLYLLPNIVSLLPRTVWMDLDIYHPLCRSLGHHILRSDADEILPGFQHSCNLNALRNIHCGEYSRKYPLGTVHFLLWLYQHSYTPATDAELLFWLADSSYINGQQHRFRENVDEWLTNALVHPDLHETFGRIDTEEFEERMEKLLQKCEALGFPRGEGRVHSRWKQLCGYQFHFDLREGDRLRRMCDFLSDTTRLPNVMEYADIHSFTRSIHGIRKSRTISSVLQDKPLEQFLNEENVFSYVFHRRREINYTTGINI